jgi:Tfp pilus assembly protein FimT
MRLKRNQRGHRIAMTLLEMLAVVTLMGIFGGMAMMRYGPTIFGNFGSQADARRLQMGYAHARRAAILSGNFHAVRFVSNPETGAALGGFQIVRLNDSMIDQAVVDGPFYFARNVQVSGTTGDIVFTFEGQALSATALELRGDNKRFQINVTPINGMCSVQQL